MALEDTSENERSAPKPGAFGRFYLQELINSGGMADIWLATDAGQRFGDRELMNLHDARTASGRVA